MSVARHHAEWLSLVETSGPFLSMPVLLRVFPQGLEQRDAAKAARLREAYEDWLERGAKTPAVHHAWIRHVLTEILEYSPEFLVEGQAIPPGIEAVMANYGETLRPEFVLKQRESGRAPALLIEQYAPDQDLEKPVAGKIWKASPGTRMMELLHATDVPLGLVTNGEQWMIVYAPRGETTGLASWYADLWMQEPLTLRVFHSLLHLRRFLGVAEPETLAALYAESSKDQQEVTDQLGYQVRRAVEMLVSAFDRIDAESERKLLAEVSEKDLYNSALTVMMRLVFLFSADERGLLLLGDPLYDQNYAVSTLSELLRERADQHGEEVLERRHDAWCRLLATFRAVHGGVEHEAMRLPPYGGTLFDPDRFPFLEGRAAGTHWRTTPAKPLPVNNRVVLHLLEALQVLRVKVPGGGPAEARRLSFRALDIEQIGHVYEGLLDHTAKRAAEVILGLDGSKNSEPEIPLAKLEELASAGTDKLIEFLQEETGRSEKALRKAVAASPGGTPENSPRREPWVGDPKTNQAPAGAADSGVLSPLRGLSPSNTTSHGSRRGLISSAPPALDSHALLIACGQDPLLAKRIKPFGPLLRDDDFGRLVVIPAGSVFVTSGSDRRSTGTHYTPRSLTEPIVQHTLEPLVYIGPAEGKPKAEWQLKSPREILALKVCDMAMGSGAFLVQTCRYLGERLVEAWENVERAANASDRGCGQSPSRSTSPPEKAPGKSESTSANPPAAAGAPHTAALQGRHFIVTPEGDLSTGSPAERLIPADPAERLAIARRYVADRCLYGVDINPMAVEMAKLSLWLITLQRDRPFTFLDHALKCGDSLLGVSSVKQVENFSLRAEAGSYVEQTFATANLFRYVEAATAKRRALEDLPSNDHTQIETKHRLHAEAEAATAKVKAVADCLIALELRGLDGDAYAEQRAEAAEQVQLLMKRDADAALKSSIPNQQSFLTAAAREALRGRRPFHWPVEFPEVFARGGFDAFIGNPPFMHGSKIAVVYGEEYADFLRQNNEGAKGKVNFVVFFMRRAANLLQNNGSAGLIFPDTVAEGGDRLAGPQWLLDSGANFYNANTNLPWPGVASVIVTLAQFRKGAWSGERRLNGIVVPNIDSRIESDIDLGTPATLDASAKIGYLGVKPDSLGFTMDEPQARSILAEKPKFSTVLKPYVSGVDLNRSSVLKPDRYIIGFTGLTLEEAQEFPELFAQVEERVKPDCPWQKWWLFNRPAAGLYTIARTLDVMMVSSRVTKFLALQFAPASWVFADKVVAVPSKSWGLFAALSSTLHFVWAEVLGANLGGTFNYQPTECIATFPLPAVSNDLDIVGERYHEHRRQLMLSRQEGLTKTYNRFHDRGEASADIARLRALHAELDQAVALAYGWPMLVNGQVVQPPAPAINSQPSTLNFPPLDLGHGFHATKQGERYTLSEPARRTVLDRLLALNHQRYEKEVEAGLHDKKSRKSAVQSLKSPVAKWHRAN